MANGLSNALAGMSPQQGQAAMQQAIGALQQKRQREATQQYRQNRLDLMQQKENRMAANQDFENKAKAVALKLRDQKQQVENDLAKAREEQARTKTKTLQKQLEQLKEKARTLESLNQEMEIPSTGETMTAGAAIRTGVFSDLVDKNMKSDNFLAAGLSPDDMPASVKKFLFLTQREGLSDKEAMNRANMDDKVVSSLTDMMKNITINSPEDVKKAYKDLQKAAEDIRGENQQQDQQQEQQQTSDDEMANDVGRWMKNRNK